MVSDVYGKNRNELMQIIVEQCSNPVSILRAGVKMIHERLKKASVKREKGSFSKRLDLLKRVAERGDATGLARILALDNKKKKDIINKRRPLNNAAKTNAQKLKPTRPSSKPIIRPSSQPARKPTRRCATS